jgi:hypothetical protein
MQREKPTRYRSHIRLESTNKSMWTRRPNQTLSRRVLTKLTLKHNASKSDGWNGVAERNKVNHINVSTGSTQAGPPDPLSTWKTGGYN